ncbi:MAG: FAD-dependent oxidoreductase [Bdellovibrio sp.]|nr:FAD-dependent oxidoreductase [Bdellovibrio sp.]
MRKKIIVIGAGIAGLTSAHYLKKSGHDVTILESSQRVGGRMTSDHLDGYIIDRGAQFLSEGYTTLIPLIKEVGLANELVESSPWAGMVRDQKICAMSIEKPFSPVVSGYLSVMEAIKYLFHMTKWAKTIFKIPLDDYSAWADFDYQNSEEFILQNFNPTTLEYLIEPQMQGLYYQNPHDSSMALALMLLSFAIRKGKILNLKNGMGSLPLKLASNLDVRLNCEVNQIEIGKENKVSINIAGETISADHVVLAVPAVIARRIYTSRDATEEALLNTQYSSTVNISLASDVKMPKSKLYGFLIPRKERKTICAIGIESNKVVGRVKTGELLDIMIDGNVGADFVNKTNSEIIDAIAPELENFFPGFLQSRKFTHVIRWRHAEPHSPIGRSTLIKKYKASLASNSPVVLAGDYLGFPYTDSAAFTGKWAAQFLITCSA